MKASNDSSMIAEGDNKRVKTINPATEDILNEYDITSKEARSVVEKRAWVMEYYADNGYLLRDDVVNTDGRKVS